VRVRAASRHARLRLCEESDPVLSRVELAGAYHSTRKRLASVVSVTVEVAQAAVFAGGGEVLGGVVQHDVFHRVTQGRLGACSEQQWESTRTEAHTASATPGSYTYTDTRAGKRSGTRSTCRVSQPWTSNVKTEGATRTAVALRDVAVHRHGWHCRDGFDRHLQVRALRPEEQKAVSFPHKSVSTARLCVSDGAAHTGARTRLKPLIRVCPVPRQRPWPHGLLWGVHHRCNLRKSAASSLGGQPCRRQRLLRPGSDRDTCQATHLVPPNWTKTHSEFGIAHSGHLARPLRHGRPACDAERCVFCHRQDDGCAGLDDERHGAHSTSLARSSSDARHVRHSAPLRVRACVCFLTPSVATAVVSLASGARNGEQRAPPGVGNLAGPALRVVHQSARRQHCGPHQVRSSLSRCDGSPAARVRGFSISNPKSKRGKTRV
jgi:hypothetical protein